MAVGVNNVFSFYWKVTVFQTLFQSDQNECGDPTRHSWLN